MRVLVIGGTGFIGSYVVSKLNQTVDEVYVLHRGRTTATSDGKLTDADGRLLAHAVTTCMIFPPAG